MSELEPIIGTDQPPERLPRGSSVFEWIAGLAAAATRRRIDTPAGSTQLSIVGLPGFMVAHECDTKHP